MGFLTKYGTAWGAIPMTGGQVHWVAPATSYTVDGRTYIASDGNDGLSPERALASINQAVTNATASVGDVICLLPGTHTVTSSVALSKAGITFIGLPYLPVPGADYGVRTLRPQTTITTSVADEAINVTAADNTFFNIRFLPVTEQKAVDFTTAAHRLTFVDCMIDLATATAHANTRGIHATSTAQAPADVVFIRCVVKEANAGTTNGAAILLGASTNFLVADCVIYKEATASSVAWTAAITVSDASTGAFVKNRFHATGIGAGDAITAGVVGATMTGGSVILFERNIATVNVTKMASTFAAADCDLALNYVATVAGGTGGTLITATA